MKLKKIKTLTKSLKIAPSTEMYERTLRDTLEAQKDSTKQPFNRNRPNIRRIIVRSKAGRIAAAAVIVIVVSVIIGNFGGSSNGTSAVYAAAMKALQNVKTVHVSGWTTCLRPQVRTELLDTSKKYTLERWEWVTEDGGYRRYTKTGDVTGWDDGDKLYGYVEHDDILYVRKSAAHASDIEYMQSVASLLSRLKEKGIKIAEIGTRTINDRPAKGWRIVERDDKQEDMWLDARTNLVLEINAHVLDGGELKRWRHATCTYDRDVPSHIREYAPPPAANVNYSPDIDPTFKKWNARLSEICAYYRQHPLPETMELLPRERDEDVPRHSPGRIPGITGVTGHWVWPVESTLEDFLRPKVKPFGSVRVSEDLRKMELNYDLITKGQPTPGERVAFVLKALGLEMVEVTEQRKVWVARYDGRSLKPWQEVKAPVARGDAGHTMPGMAWSHGATSVRELFEGFVYYQDYHLSADKILIINETGLPCEQEEGESVESVAVSSVSPYWRGDESIPIARKWFEEQFGITFAEEMREMTVHVVRKQN